MGGSSGSSQTPVTQQTTQTRDPWGPSQPFLLNAMNSAQNFYNANVGYQPYTGSMQADLHPWESQGLGTQYSIAAGTLGGTPGVNAARNLGTDLIQNQGLTPGLNTAIGRYNTLYDEASGQQNPYLQNILETNNRRIGDRINASMAGAGRYGSGQHTDVMARALAESADPILAEDYARRQQQRMQATGAAAGLYGEGLQRSGQWSQLMPTLDQAQYAPSERMSAVGQFYTDYAQRALDNQIKQYNAQQAYPWEQLARLNAIVGGAGGLGGTTVTTQPGATQPSSTQRLFGGALAGAGLGSAIFPGVGTAVGALGGGLLGMM